MEASEVVEIFFSEVTKSLSSGDRGKGQNSPKKTTIF